MAITFRRAPLVAKGDRLTSTQVAGLANAINDRMRSGLGDPTQRIDFYVQSATVQIRNPDASGFGFAPRQEYLETYQAVKPLEAQWPPTSPGEPEGINVASIAGAYVFGAAAIDTASEDVRLGPAGGGIPLWLGTAAPETPEEIWMLGQQQRGAYDPSTGAVACPAFTAARSFYTIHTSRVSPHGNAYGGYQPHPEEIAPACGDGPPASINYQYFFTRLVAGSTAIAGTTSTGSAVGDKLNYNGSCPDVAGDLVGFADLPWAYYVLRSGQTALDVIDKNLFFWGPYDSGGKLQKSAGNHAQRMFMGPHAREYRGSDEQRDVTPYRNKNAFDSQKFHAEQYHLAPNVGSQSGEFVTAIYPRFNLSGSVLLASGTSAQVLTAIHPGNNSAIYDPGTMLTAALVRAQGLRLATRVRIRDGATILATVSLVPDSAGDFSQIITFQPRRPAALAVELLDSASFDSGGKIEVEFNQILEYKPEEYDRFLVLRMAGANLTSTVDGIGTEEPFAKEIGDNYFLNACILNSHSSPGLPGSLAEINTNGAYDAMRRFSKCVRVLTRRNFVGYAVEGGKSICWFKRYAYGLSHGVVLDLFDGIGPNRLQIATGALQWGRTYIVRRGVCSYNSAAYSANSTFTAVEGKKDFAGDCDVYEFDGIRSVAPPLDTTNEWLMDVSFKVYSWSDSSIWKPESYSDYYAWSDRCMFYPSLTKPADLTWHVAYGENIWIAPESVTVNRYSSGMNPTAAAAFFKSCRIYETPNEVESAVVVIEGGEEIVKLTFKKRFHNTSLEATDPAPTSIDRDISTWSVAALDLELSTNYRTTENGLREYLLHDQTGRQCRKAVEGDAAADSLVATFPDDPWGACFPSFWLTRLIRLPYVDANDRQDRRWDTKATHDEFAVMEMYLRCMCEGAIDTTTTQERTCAHANQTLMDYTFENCCYDAFGGRAISTLDSTQRQDILEGFGPIPNVEFRAEVFNQFSKVVNKLTKFRVPLPISVEVRAREYDGAMGVQCINSTGGLLAYTTGSCHGFYTGDFLEATNPVSVGAFGAVASFQAHADSIIDITSATYDPLWQLSASKTAYDFRIQLVNAAALGAIPETWRDMVDVAFGALVDKTTTTRVQGYDLVGAGLGSDCGAPSVPDAWPDGAGNYYKFNEVVTAVCERLVLSNGIQHPPPIGSGTIPMGRNVDGDDCSTSQQSDILIAPVNLNETFVEIPLIDP